MELWEEGFSPVLLKVIVKDKMDKIGEIHRVGERFIK